MDEDEQKRKGDVCADETESDLLTLFAPVYEVVRAIPAGKVMTYGQVADEVTGVVFTARQVGTAMRYVPDGVPWQRVVGAGGHLPIAKLSPEAQRRQQHLLMQEGAIFLERDPMRVDMTRSQHLIGTAEQAQDEAQHNLFDRDEAR